MKQSALGLAFVKKHLPKHLLPAIDLPALLSCPCSGGASRAAHSVGCVRPPTEKSVLTNLLFVSVCCSFRMDTAGAAHQPRLALLPFGIEALHNAGQATSLVAGMVLILGNRRA